LVACKLDNFPVPMLHNFVKFGINGKEKRGLYVVRPWI
jgi:hypothetical protein